VIREATGIVGDVKGLASTGVRAVRTRLELLSIELKEEKAWLVRSVVVAVAALYLLSFGLMLAILALVLFAAEENRPAILAWCAAGFILAGVGGGLYLKSAASKRGSLFEDTIKVLKGDEEGLHQALRGTGD
jgi:uncharacterized membrane protein YqjE